MPKSMENIFHELEGRWSIKRTLTFDASDIWCGEGSVIFTKNTDNILHYREDIKITLPNGNMQDGFQEYEFRYDPEKGSISKYRSSGELMYRLAFKDGLYHGIYQCGLDEYIANYNFIDDSHFTLQYEIHGPKKDCVIITEFERVEMDFSGIVLQGDITVTSFGCKTS